MASVTLCDDSVVGWNDLSSHFYLAEDDIGKSRVAACIDKLSQLNTYVTVQALPGPIDESTLKRFQVFVYFIIVIKSPGP